MAWDGDAYQQRFDELARRGEDVHGEARFVLAFDPAAVLDAGCGTGRVAIELARHGVEVVGVDSDRSMLSTARRQSDAVTWVESDLSTMVLGRTFDVVVMAGNVPLFTPFGSEPGLVAGCARHVADDGVLVAGFSTDQRYRTADYDGHCRAAGLTLVERWSSWSRDPWTEDSEYAVSVHARSPVA